MSRLLTLMLFGSALVGPSPFSLYAKSNTREKDSATIVVTRPEVSKRISPLLMGAQFNFFNMPIVKRIDDKSLLKTWKAVPVNMLRYPGGTWGDHYIWDNPAGGYFAVGDADHVVTQEQFIAVCRFLGAEPIFQINIVSKGGRYDNRINPTNLLDIKRGARWAAAWVHEANIVKKWDVKYWEIGNETWIWLKPEEYAQYVVEYSKAMKSVDPSIKIIACGLAHDVGPFQSKWLNFPDDPEWKPRPDLMNTAVDWNDALVNQAKGAFDYLAPHIYVEAFKEEEVSTEERYMATTRKIFKNTRLNGQVELAQNNDWFRIAVTEWGTNFKQSVPVKKKFEESLYFYSLANGLNTAFFFGKMVQASKVLDIAIIHCLDDIQSLWFWPLKAKIENPLEHPTLLALKIWGNNLGKTFLNTEIQGGPIIKDDQGDDHFALFAQASEDEENYCLVAINLSPSQATDLTYAWPENCLPQGAAMRLSGSELGSNNFSAWDSKSQPGVQILNENLSPEGGQGKVSLAPHSMIGIKIPKR